MGTDHQEQGEEARREALATGEVEVVTRTLGADLEWSVFDGERDWTWPKDRERIFELAELENFDRDPGDPYVMVSFEPVELGRCSDSAASLILSRWDQLGDYEVEDATFTRAVDGAKFRLLTATHGDVTTDLHLLVHDSDAVAILEVAVA